VASLMRYLTFSTASFVVALSVTTVGAQAEVSFPETRNSVGVGEFYALGKFDGWEVFCRRDANSEDYCEATAFIADHAAGVRLDFSVTPVFDFTAPIPVTVDVATRALVSIKTTSASEKNKDFTAAISAVDGVLFDGYSCPITDLNACDRGPELVLQDARRLISAEMAQLEITRLSNGETVTTIEVSLAGLQEAYHRANAFNAEIRGVDLTDTRSLGEMCNFVNDRVERRISYLLDADSDFSQPSMLETLRGARGSATCPSYIILSYFTPNMTPAQREMFCLAFNAEGREYMGAQLGEADTYRVCREPSKSICENVNDSRDVALATVRAARAITGGAATATAATGVTVVTHSSGAAILTGGAGYIANTIGPLAATVGILTSPVSLGITAISVVGVHGALFVCRERDNQE